MPPSTHTADEYEFVTHAETTLSPEAVNKILEWLQPTDYLAESGEFRRHLASQAPGTGLWICQTDEYQKWHDSPDHGSLWIKGVPGAGKSVTAASIIQHLRTTEDCPVLFFFFRNIVAANFSPRALVQDWLAQLLPHSPKLQFALQPHLGTSLAETSDADLIQLFLDGVSCVPKVYCVADALDEMDATSRPFLDKLNSLATFRPHSLKLLITSRPKQHLQSALRDSSIVHISLQQQFVDADIASYLCHRFDTTPMPDAQLQAKQQVVDMVARRSEGLFLYAKLTMDQVEASLQAHRPADIAALEQSLPVGLEHTYSSMLARQRQEDGVTVDLQVFVLEAATHASRPLRLHELASLVKCVYPSAAAEPQDFKLLVARSCGPLLEILEDETLQVIHHSLTEFLRGDTRNPLEIRHTVLVDEFPIIDSGKAHKHMAINCLHYLLSGALLGDTFDYAEARLNHPFLRYAVENWPYHASRYDVEDDELFSTVNAFLGPKSISFSRWLSLQHITTKRRTKINAGTDILPSSLHIAAFSGMSMLAAKMIGEGADLTAVDDRGRIPLHWAAENGHANTVSLLIEHGSDLDAIDRFGWTPILVAAANSHASVITVLLKAGVRPDTAKTKENFEGYVAGGSERTIGKTAIIYVSEAGHADAASALVPFCTQPLLEQLLCECCRLGHTDAVLAVLGGSDVSGNATDRGATALYLACSSVNTQCVEALLARGADPNRPSEYNPRRQRYGGGFPKLPLALPLHRLVSAWEDKNNAACEAIFRMLVRAGADIESLDGKGDTALFCVIKNAKQRRVCVPALRALLDARADVKAKDKSGDTVLHTLLENYPWNPEAVRILVARGLDPNERGNCERTALHCGLIHLRCHPGIEKEKEEETNKEIIQYLLDHGADPNIRMQGGISCVQLARHAGIGVFALLLAKGNDDIAKVDCWFDLPNRGTADFAERLRLLLEAGVDVDTRSSTGETLYLRLASSKVEFDFEKLRILERLGAKTDIVDNYGNNALHHACRSSDGRKLIEHLVAVSGLDPLATNSMGETLLHLAVPHFKGRQKDVEFVQWLMKMGISVNAQSKDGTTVLHQYAKGQVIDIYSHHVTAGFLETINSHNEVDFEIRDNNGMTAVHLAVVRSDSELSSLSKLVKAGADMCALTADGQTALHLACCARRPDMAGMILRHPGSIQVDHQDKHGMAALHFACSSGEAESVALLLQHGANASIADATGFTPLHATAMYSLEQATWEACRDNIQKGWQREFPSSVLLPANRSWHRRVSKPWCRDSPHPGLRSEIKRAFNPGVAIIVKLLIESKCNLVAVDWRIDKNAGRTALDIALDTGCAEFTDVFVEDEQLFMDATSNLVTQIEIPHESENRQEDLMKEVAAARQRIKAQMVLMRPQSALPMLGQLGDQSLSDYVWQHPEIYLELLTSDDAAAMINKRFESNPLDAENYETLQKVLQSDRLDLVSRLANLVLHFSSYASLKDCLTRQRVDSKYVDEALTPLQLVCRSPRPNMLMLRLLVEKLHVDVNGHMALYSGSTPYDNDGEIVPGGTALHVLASATQWWQVDGMQYLLDNGANIEAKDEGLRTAVHVAAPGVENSPKQGMITNRRRPCPWRVENLRVLLSYGADPNSVDKDGNTALHRSCQAPDGATMQALLEAGGDATIGNQSPMFQAIYDQNTGAVEALLAHGVNPDLFNEPTERLHYRLDDTPRKGYALLRAAYAGGLNSSPSDSVPVLRTLVCHGADLYAPLNETETLLHFLFEHTEHTTVATLLEEPCVSRIDMGRRDQRGRTMLHASCLWPSRDYCGSQELPTKAWPPLRLVDMGVSAALVDNDGMTALHHLLCNKWVPEEVIIEFINRQEEVVPRTMFVRNNRGFLPFHLALRHLRPAVCRLLLAKGADILEADPEGLTVLHHVALQFVDTAERRRPRPRPRQQQEATENSEYSEFFEQRLGLWNRFLEAGGSINTADHDGDTALHAFMLASQEKSYEPRCHLAHYDRLFPGGCGVDVFATNHEGKTALHAIAMREKKHWESESHDKALFQMMMGKGLDPLQGDKQGRSALDVASALERDDILSLFGRKD